MKIWIIQLDPETETIEPESGIKEIEVTENKSHFITEEGRKIDKHSTFQRFFYTEQDAKDYWHTALISLKKYYRERLRLVNVEIKKSKIAYGLKPPSLIRVISPDNKEIICTRKRASEVIGVSLSAVHMAIQRDSRTRNGYFLERVI